MSGITCTEGCVGPLTEIIGDQTICLVACLFQGVAYNLPALSAVL
jgi:hypothetical protein